MKALLSSIYIFFGFIITHNANGQTNGLDSTFLLSALNKLSQHYINVTDNDGSIYNGKEYLNYDKYYLKGHQFFKSSEEQEGDVFYENYLHTKTPLLYDVVLDQIVISEPGGSLQFKLENQKVNYFKLHGHLFIHLNTDSVSGSSMRSGFYNMLVDGKTQLLARRTKRVIEDPTPRGMEGEFLIEDKFFVRRGNQYYPVSKKKSVLKVFNNSKKELQKYSRNQRLNFKKENRETSLMKLIKYYDTLPAQTPGIN